MQWTGKRVILLKKEKKINLRKEKARNNKKTLNAIIAKKENITQKIITPKNKTERQ
jgi:hypothetical protein